jgi:hypothetical protein
MSHVDDRYFAVAGLVCASSFLITSCVVFRDRVDKKRRLPVAEAVEEDGDVQHGVSLTADG